MSKKKIIIWIIIVIIIITIAVGVVGYFVRPVRTCSVGDDIRVGKDFINCICIGQKEVDNLWEKGGYGVSVECKGLMFGVIAR